MYIFTGLKPGMLSVGTVFCGHPFLISYTIKKKQRKEIEKRGRRIWGEE